MKLAGLLLAVFQGSLREAGRNAAAGRARRLALVDGRTEGLAMRVSGMVKA